MRLNLKTMRGWQRFELGYGLYEVTIVGTKHGMTQAQRKKVGNVGNVHDAQAWIDGRDVPLVATPPTPRILVPILKPRR